MPKETQLSPEKDELLLAKAQEASTEGVVSLHNSATDLHFLSQVTHPTAQPQRIQAMQRLAKTMGNSALLQRMNADSVLQREDAIPAEMHDFLKRGMMPTKAGQDIIGPSGRGGFNAKFDPDARELIVTVNVGFTFLHGLNIDESSGVVTPNVSGLNTSNGSEAKAITRLTTAATNIMADTSLDVAGRTSLVNNEWRWADGESTPWLTQYRQAVVDAWSGKHFFVSKRWPQLQSSVRVVVNVHEGAAKGDHCAAKIVKTPPKGIGASVNRGSKTNAHDQKLLLNSSQVDPNNFSFLRKRLFFENNSADVNTAKGSNGNSGPTYLNKFIKTFAAGYSDAGVPIEITGHASSTGAADYNQTLSEKRAKNVEDYLKSNGLTGDVNRTTQSATGEEGATGDAHWRRVDIQVGSGENQVVAAHEFGHMIGLQDEYAFPAGGFGGSGTGGTIGDPVAHDAMAKAMGSEVRGAVTENTDSIMSLGNTVRPQHYATFHHALQEITGEKWEYGSEGDAPGVLPTGPFSDDDTVVV